MENNIAKLRKEKGYSQQEFAEMLDISFWWLSNIETGYRSPSLKLTLRIAEKLGVTPNDIFLR